MNGKLFEICMSILIFRYGTVNIIRNSPVPSDITLDQNYPNPFNPNTTISFSIQYYTHITIKVIDILGREIKKIADDFYTPGTHTVKFSAINLSSGIYFYTLQTSSFNQTRKMFLLK